MSVADRLVEEAKKGTLRGIIQKYNEVMEKEKNYKFCLGFAKKFYVYIFVMKWGRGVECFDGTKKFIFLGKVGKSADSLKRYDEIDKILKKYFGKSKDDMFGKKFLIIEWAPDKSQNDIETMVRERIRCSSDGAEKEIVKKIEDFRDKEIEKIGEQDSTTTGDDSDQKKEAEVLETEARRECATHLRNVGRTEFVWISQDTLEKLKQKEIIWNEFKKIHEEDTMFQCSDCNKEYLCSRKKLIMCEKYGCKNLHCQRCHLNSQGLCFDNEYLHLKNAHVPVVGDREKYRKENPQFFDLLCICEVTIGGKRIKILNRKCWKGRISTYSLYLGKKCIDTFSSIVSVVEVKVTSPKRLILVALNYSTHWELVVGRDVISGEYQTIKSNEDKSLVYKRLV